MFCGCCCSHPSWNVIFTVIIRYKIRSFTILFKLPDEVCCDQTKPVGENKEVNKICCCVLLTRIYLKNLFKKLKTLPNFKSENGLGKSHQLRKWIKVLGADCTQTTSPPPHKKKIGGLAHLGKTPLPGIKIPMPCRAVSKFRVTCCPELQTHNKFVVLWVN